MTRWLSAGVLDAATSARRAPNHLRIQETRGRSRITTLDGFSAMMRRSSLARSTRSRSATMASYVMAGCSNMLLTPLLRFDLMR
ncbi:hypothetical protein [Microbacterium sp. TWP3-1-2b2]|uniref:hypothetical protein n=1 Tax=Microbacterium sp. TWP3-1-2b2 TaxID=2804651 RepID=UPI003CE96F64